MTVTEFVPNAVRTESVVESIQFNKDQFWRLMDASIAFGELMDIVKKSAFYNKRINPVEWEAAIKQIMYSISEVQMVPGINHEPVDVGIENTRLFHAAIGMFTESVEMLQAIDTATQNGEPVDGVNFAEETFDTSWYQAIAWDELGINPETGFYTVIEKLRKRYPEKFTSDAAINRNLVAEREILETGFK
jgi:hypothetical protein